MLLFEMENFCPRKKLKRFYFKRFSQENSSKKTGQPVAVNRSAATSVMKIAVEVEEDWQRAVNNRPRHRPQ